MAFFNPSKVTRLIADASPVALGAVLLQFDKDEPRVISYANKSLSDTERRYSQTEKESLALVWAVERFYYYLAGMEFELVTDHKPLETIFKPTANAPARIERWLLRLQPFKFRVIYKSGKSNIADPLSRLCQIKIEESFDGGSEVYLCALVERNVPKAVRIAEVQAESENDTEINEACQRTISGDWKGAEKNVFHQYRYELTVVGSTLLRGTKLVIPMSLRQRLLRAAHEGHPGETVMKRRLRAKVWWPLIDRQAEAAVKQCQDCLLVAQPNRPPPMTRYTLPRGPWLEVAMDLLGPLPNGEYVLVIIDYYSRYTEVFFLTRITSENVIKCLKEVFARLGNPKSIRVDNGRQFTSQELRKYCEEEGIDLVFTPPYWPQANGEVENMNKAIGKRLKISHANGLNLKEETQKFLKMYNATPHGTTGKSPSELLFGRNIRDKIPSAADLELEGSDTETRSNDRRNKQKGKEREDNARRARPSDIAVGDKVVAQNLVKDHKLTTRFGQEEFIVQSKSGNEVTISNGDHTLRRHVTQVKSVPDTRLDNSETEEASASTSRNPTAGEEQTASDGEAGEVEARVPPLKLKKKDGMWQPREA